LSRDLRTDVLIVGGGADCPGSGDHRVTASIGRGGRKFPA
jgi:hypothetical protein